MIGPTHRNQAGSTLPELLMAVAIIGMITGFVIYRTEATAGGLKTGTDRLVSIIKLARSEAMANTTPHRVVTDGDTALSLEFGGPCDDVAATWTAVPDSRVELDDDVRLATTGWTICFTSRGWTTTVHEVRLLEDASYQDVSVLLGGSTRVHPVVRYP